jgi:formate transporter
VSDAYAPAEIAARLETLGVNKAGTDTGVLIALSVLAGAFVSLGAVFFTVAITGSTLGFGLTSIVGGLSFCLGLVLVVVAGAELFTGNNLLAVAWASGRIGGRDVVRNWLIVYAGNVVGCLGTVALVAASGIAGSGGGAVGETALQIAVAKSGLPLVEAFARGILCNALVCLAIWLAMGGRSVADKILAILFPITAFVALGFEHSIANWFLLPYGLLLDVAGSVSLLGVATNLLVVTLGNVVGGTLLVSSVYWFAYLRPTERPLAARRRRA